jgi:rSAM/selenodomain-associated transferase 1
MSGDVLIVFVKAARSGSVKTRLIPALGPEGAADLYRVLAEEEVRRTRPEPGDYERLFFFAPAEAEAGIASWFPGETLLPQQGVDLGAKMAAAFEEAFRRGARRAAIIGTDVPWVSRALVLEALRDLDQHDVVLGPSHDGGYYLLALDRPRPELFAETAWSSPQVLPGTLAKAQALGLSVRLLEQLTDIDTLEDVRHAWAELKPMLPLALAAALTRALAAA